MRQLVNTKTFRLKKRLDNLIHTLIPNHWVPLYSMVCEENDIETDTHVNIEQIKVLGAELFHGTPSHPQRQTHITTTMLANDRPTVLWGIHLVTFHKLTHTYA